MSRDRLAIAGSEIANGVASTSLPPGVTPPAFTVPPDLADARNTPLEQLLAAQLADQRQHWEEGDAIGARNYLDRFPAIASDPEAAAALVYNEFILSAAAG